MKKSNNAPKTTIVYKVCSNPRDWFYPPTNIQGFALTSSWNWLPVGYDIGKVTVPKVGKLFAFDTLENAKKAFESMTIQGGVVRIFKAEATGARGLKYSAEHKGHVKDFWRVYGQKKRLTGRDFVVRPTPKGCVVCDSIKLVELVYIAD